MQNVLGFIALGLIIYSFVLLGWKKRYAFLVGGLGNAIWVYIAVYRSPFQIDLAISSLVFVILNIHNFILWGRTK